MPRKPIPASVHISIWLRDGFVDRWDGQTKLWFLPFLRLKSHRDSVGFPFDTHWKTLPPRLLAGCPDGPRPCLRSWRLERPRQSRLDQRHEQRAQGRPRGRRARLDAPAARRRYLGWRPTRLRRGGRRRSGLAHAGLGQTMVPAGQGGKPLLASPQPTWPRAANSQIRCLGLFHGAGLSLRPIDLADRPDTLKAAAGVSPIPTRRYVRAAPVRTNQGDPSCPQEKTFRFPE